MAKQVISLAEIATKEVLTRKEAAVYLGVSIGWLNQLCAKRAIPFYCPMGKLSYFKRADLDEWCCKNRKSTIDEINAKAAGV